MSSRLGAPAATVAAALTAIYLIWGSTYLAMSWAVKAYPPFFLAGVRALAAGMLLYSVMRIRGAPRPELRHWTTAVIVGGLLLVAGNGLVSWSAQFVPSGIIALLIALLPVWMVVFGYLHGTERRTPIPVWCGITLGLIGVGILVGPKILPTLNGSASTAGAWGTRELIGAAIIFFSSMCWANGSLLSRRMAQPKHALLGVGMQLLCGGLMALAVSAASGEWTTFNAVQAFGQPRPTISLVYLTLVGTLIAYPVYIWLLHTTTPAMVATYAYVNPVIAVALGWGLNGEAMAPATIAGATIIVAGVVVIVSFNQKKPAAAPALEPAPVRAGGQTAA